MSSISVKTPDYNNYYTVEPPCALANYAPTILLFHISQKEALLKALDHDINARLLLFLNTGCGYVILRIQKRIVSAWISFACLACLGDWSQERWRGK